MLKIEHLGIAVKNIAESNLLFEKLLNTPSYKMEEVKSEGVLTSFFKVGENKIELLEATNPDSPIAKFIVDYFLRLGFLDGNAGFTVARISAHATHLKYKKIHEHIRLSK